MFFVLMVIEQGGMRVRNWLNSQSNEDSKDQDNKVATHKFDDYRMNDTIAGIVLGSFQQVSMLFLELAGVELATACYSLAWQYRLLNFDIKKNVYVSYIVSCATIALPLLIFFMTLKVLLLGVDCGYYWAHRMMHEWHIAWVPHSVHHSGETYNLATALRQGAFQPLFSWVFYLPLALLGFPPNAFAGHSQLSTLYMYWIHTELVNRLPFGLEYIFNSPMAHRMHHRPPGNCNYAGMLIW